MPRRPLVPFLVLLVALAVAPACNKKKPPADGGGGDPAPGPTPPSSVSSDYVVFAHLNAKAIRDSTLFTEVKQAFAKAGGTAEWDRIENEASEDLGVKPTDIDSVTVCVTEVPPRNVPKFVLILAANKPIDKAAALRLGPQQPDARGFYKSGQGLVHFPDDKTMVMVHPDLTQQYLDGYAKNRTGWPLTSDLTQAAAGHTLYAQLNLHKIPSELLRGPNIKEFEPLLAARTVTLTADLKGKELSLAAKAAFPDAAAAGQAKDVVQKFVGMAAGALDLFLGAKGGLGGVQPVVVEAQRALKDAKVDVAGSDVSLAASYKANFDIGPIVADAVVKVRESAVRMKAQNNLKQIGLGLHSFHDSNGRLLVHGVGPKGAALKTATDKPLLSWRVAILPYIDQGPLYQQFKLDEPWDSPNNKKLIDKMPTVYAPSTNPPKPGHTHLQMVVGPNAMQPTMGSFSGITDGMSNTIAVVEAAEPVIWTKPDDVMLPGNQVPKDLKKKFGGWHPGGFNALMWDGSVRFVSDSISEKTLSLVLNPRDGMVIPGDW